MRISRRELINLSSLSLGSLAFSQLLDRLPPEEHVPFEPLKQVRVAIRYDEVRTEPSLDAPIVDVFRRDDLVRVIEELVSPYGPAHNPRWYKVMGGYMHTAHLAPVETHLNDPIYNIREEGQAFRVTVPYTQTMRRTEAYGWQNLYRLYFNSNHWITGIDSGPDGKPWYIISENWPKVQYHVRAEHLQLIPDSAYEPITPDVVNKWVEVSLEDQTITCFEENEVVFHTQVSTGIPSLGVPDNGIPTETPRGVFHVQQKTPVRHMGNGRLTNDINAYELPGVPWSIFINETGVAFHGTYWHDNYGGRMSHGCINMRTDEANWLFRWTTPIYKNEPGVWHQIGYGTKIIVR